MWFLITPEEKRIYLKPNNSVSIGRKNNDIILLNDASISRLHASIVVKPHTELVAGKPTSLCILKDEGSKYGTYIYKNEKFEKVTNDVNINDQDIIRFGLRHEVFIATYKPIITMISALQDNEKDKLSQIMDAIDGVIISDWNKYCTHLTVTKPKLTQKVAISLAASIPIVTVDYWDTVKSSIERGDPLPKTDKFIPEISEQYISKEVVSLFPNCERKTLFTNLTFNFFSSKQYEMYRTMVTLAGGKAVLYNLNKDEDNTLKRDYIFIQCSSADSTQFADNFKKNYDYICNKLNASKHRIIPESEIPLAILYCSIEQYCNTKYNFGKFLKRKDKINYDISETLVLDTQDQDIFIIKDFKNKQTSSHSKNCIPETLEYDGNESIQENEMSQKSSNNSKQLTSEVKTTISKKMIIPETIESFHDSQRNVDQYNNKLKSSNNSKQLTPEVKNTISRKVLIPDTIESFHDSQRNVDQYNNKLKSSNNSKQLIPEVKKTISKKMLIPETIESFHDSQRNVDQYNNENNESIINSRIGDSCSPKTKICIPETVDNNYSNSFANSNKQSQTSNSFAIINISSEEDDCNVSIKKQPNTNIKNTLQNPSQTKTTNNVRSNEIQTEKEANEKWVAIVSSHVQEADSEEEDESVQIGMRCNPPGKTFQKARVKIPAKRLRLMDFVEECC